MTPTVSSEVWKLDPVHPDEKKLSDAVRFLNEGKVIVFPTETVYGIGVASSRKEAAGAIYELKGREQQKPLSLHIASLAQVPIQTLHFPRLVNYLVHRFWPGPLTLIAKTRENEALGLRFPKNPIARRLIELLGEPMLATSANLSAKEPAKSVEEAEGYFGHQIPLYLDGGRTEFGEASTVLDVTEYPPKFVREGCEAGQVREALSSFEGFRFAKKMILLVCTGNTCRSPMAEGWLNQYLAEEGQADGFWVASCGTAAITGIPPTQEAIDVLKEEDIDISEKRSRPIHEELIRQADFIFVMTAAHKNYILELNPEVEKRIAVLDVEDPIGLEKEEYEKIYVEIKARLKKELEWILKF